MGALFAVEHANFVAFLTNDSEQSPPRADRESLCKFLATLYTDDHGIGGVTEIVGGGKTIISSRSSWVDGIETCARSLHSQLYSSKLPDVLPPELVGKFLNPLREFFTGYLIYALILPKEEWVLRDYEADIFFMRFAYESKGHGLVLRPWDSRPVALDVIDPFPALRALADTPLAPPSVVFWTSAGATCVLPLNEATEFFQTELVGALSGTVESMSALLKRRSNRTSVRRILQMSDLHFGRPEAARRKRYLKDHLSQIVKDVDRVVITGDLFDSPDSAFKSEFDDFRIDVEELTRRDIIVIPGNHDVRTKGNKFVELGQSFQQLAGLRWNPIVVDDDLRAVFFCFNSAEEGDFARGQVPEQQRLDRASEFERLRRRNPVIDDYVKLALVHHHPYPHKKLEFEDSGFYYSRQAPLYERIVRAIFKNEDEFLAFEEAEAFISWCAERGVSIILHGHKHAPRRLIDGNGILVVGCGSTTGAEETPMSYNIVSYDPHSARWGVSFFYDPSSDGSGFRLQNITVSGRS